jgi:hypothetical protein
MERADGGRGRWSVAGEGPSAGTREGAMAVVEPKLRTAGGAGPS